jgi:hypothetical protein
MADLQGPEFHVARMQFEPSRNLSLGLVHDDLIVALRDAAHVSELEGFSALAQSSL